MGKEHSEQGDLNIHKKCNKNMDEIVIIIIKMAVTLNYCKLNVF